jgi:putative amide transporter protein
VASVGLLYVGAVLFVNAIMLLGRAEPRSVGVFNIFVGVLQTAVPFYVIATTNDPNTILNASGIFLFGFTYLYVGITNLGGFDTSGLGWYCLWVAIIAIPYSLVNFFIFGDVVFGVIWILWSFLWALFFMLLALKRENLTRFTGWVTLIISWITCTIPAYLLLIGAL